MSRIIKAELYKIINVPSFVFSMFFAFPAGAIWGVVKRLDADVTMVDLISGIMTYFIYFMLAMVILYITNDYEKGTIKAIVSSGVSKSKIYFGRLIVSVIIAEVVYIFSLIGTYVYGIAAGIPMTNADNPWTAGQFLSSILIQMVFVILYASIGYFIGVVIRKQVVSLMAAPLLVGLEPVAVGCISSFFKTDLTILNIQQIVLQMDELNLSGNILAGTVIFVAVVIVITFAIGVQIFKKRDV